MAAESLSHPLRAAIYARVSTNNGSQHPEMQLEELRQYAARRGFVVAAEYVDHMSGAKETRPSLCQLMSDAQQRNFDLVLVWKLDRWGRSFKHLVTSPEQLESLGVAFVSLRENLDLSTPSGRLMFHIIGAMAQFEKSLIQERVKVGLKSARNKGQRLGRPKVYANAHTIAELRERGASWVEIRDDLKLRKGTAQRAFYSLSCPEASNA